MPLEFNLFIFVACTEMGHTGYIDHKIDAFLAEMCEMCHKINALS